MVSKSMKLGTKLGMAFMALFLLTLTVGGFGLLQLSNVNVRTQEISDAWLPSIKMLGEIRTAANQLRRQEADHTMSADAAEMSVIEQRMADGKAALAHKEKAYEPLISSSAEQAAYDEYKKHRDAYLSIQAKLLDLSRSGDRNIEQAKALFRGDSRTAFNAMAAELGKLVDINDQGSSQAAIAAHRTYESARLWVLALLAVSAVSSFGLAVVIVRSVTSEIGGEPADAAALARRVAEGDLSVSIALRPGDDTSLLAALKRMQDGLTSIVTGVRANAQALASASAQIAQGDQELSSRTEQEASALEETAAAMEQLAATVKQNADNAVQGNRLALDASKVASQGGTVVNQVVETMRDINTSSQKIAEIIGVIDGIAFQTNILALNAAVEAARAGEQGRGFAVVAGDVRALAQRSAGAAHEIKALINSSVERVGQGAELADRAGATMRDVVSSIQRVTHIMGEISTASSEQSNGVAQVGEAVSQMDKTTQQNAALVEEIAAAAESLTKQAQQLVHTVAVFKVAHSDAPAASLAAQPQSHHSWSHATPRPASPVKKPALKAAASRPAEAHTPSAHTAPGAHADKEDWTSF